MDVQGGGSGGGVAVAEKLLQPYNLTTVSSVDDLQDGLDKFIQLIYQRCIIVHYTRQTRYSNYLFRN